jgi:single-strand DNA-binding protein
VVIKPFRGELTMLDSKGSGGGMGVSDMDQSSYSAPVRAAGSGGAATAAKVDEFEDEIPF